MRLEAHELAFGYPERLVGSGVSLSLGAGEVLCLLGPNGCGKTTLFKTMLGLLPAVGGSIRIGETALPALSRQEIARRIAYVPQAQGGIFPYTALDLVLMGRTAHRGLFAGPTREDREIARQALAELGIAHLAERDVTRLSGGQRQLVVVARAIAQAAPLIVMDEPTAALDFGNQVVVLSEVRRLAERGAGIVLSTHDPDHAFAVAHRVALMQDGHLVATGPPGDVLTPERLRQVYGVEVTIGQLPGGQTVCAPSYAPTRRAKSS
jgi:iron complex transport system ATP-binding protein